MPWISQRAPDEWKGSHPGAAYDVSQNLGHEPFSEAASVQAIIDKVEMVTNNNLGLYQLDKEVSARQ